MAGFSDNTKKALKIIFLDYLTSYNAYSIKDKVGISGVGSLKLLRNLKQKNILVSERLGNAVFYKPNLKSDYVLKLLELVLLENNDLPPYVKGWVHDLKAFSDYAEAIFLFGSVLSKGKSAGDVDVCFILAKADDYRKVNDKVSEVNKRNRLKIHPLYLTEEEFEKKLSVEDAPLVGMVKRCVVVKGEGLLVKALKNAQ